MQGNDLGTYVEHHHIVILCPTIFTPPELSRRERFSMFARRATMAERADQYTMNNLMVRWIQYEGYNHNIPTEIWSFEPEDVYEELVERLSQVCDRYIFRFNRWVNESDAAADLMASLNNVTRVYDADSDRVDRLWRFNGFKVMPGGSP